MAKNKTKKKSNISNKNWEEKSAFRVEEGRAMKAKKNKAFVKFNKVCVAFLISNFAISQYE